MEVAIVSWRGEFFYSGRRGEIICVLYEGNNNVVVVVVMYRFSVLEMQDHSIDNLGSPKLDLLLCLFVIYCLLYVILFRGIRSTGS